MMVNSVILLFRAVALMLLFTISQAFGVGHSPKEQVAKETGTIELLNARARATLPGMSSSAAYMTIHNGGNKPVQVQALASPIARKTELHTTEMNDGMMTMRRVDNLQINPGAAVELKPGGYHIMLMGLKQPIAADSEIPVIITFDNGEQITVMARTSHEVAGQHIAH